MKKSKYYCDNVDCKDHIDEKEELKIAERVLNGCRVYNYKGLKSCKERKNYISPQEKVETMKTLLEKIGEEAFNNLLESKSVLHVWRGTTPYNIWISKDLEDNGEYEYHSYSEGSYYSRPSLFGFEVLKDSDEKIARSLSPSEIGSPYHTIYQLKQDFIDAWNKSR